MIVAFEGVDGVGKTTCLNLVAKELKAQGKSVIVIRDPYDGDMSLIDGTAKSYYSNRKLMYRKHSRISKGIYDDEIVLLDRCFVSTHVYQNVDLYQDLNIDIIFGFFVKNWSQYQDRLKGDENIEYLKIMNDKYFEAFKVMSNPFNDIINVECRLIFANNTIETNVKKILDEISEYILRKGEFS